MADRDPRLDEVAKFSNLPRHVKMDALRPDKFRRFGHVYHPPTDEVFSVHDALYLDVLRAHPIKESDPPPTTIAGQPADTDRIAELEEAIADQNRTIQQLMELMQGQQDGAGDGKTMTDIPIRPDVQTLAPAPSAPKAKDAGK